MKLSITEDEIKDALVEWMRGRIGNEFNHVEFEFRYGAFQEAIFSKKEPLAEPSQISKSAAVAALLNTTAPQ